MSFRRMVEMDARRAAVEAAPEQCEHKHAEVRCRTIRGGSKQYVPQCLFCGESIGNPVKQAGAVPDFDEELRESYAERRRALMNKAQRERTTQWWNNYREYMASEAWRDLRIKVLHRDNYQCQGCLDAMATEVHHMTYAHFGAEFAFELKALCKPCHERLHDKEDE